MEFFDRFAWAVPLAFREAVGNCRFEEGDILYDDRSAYCANWKKVKNHTEFYIQIVSPQRSTGGTQSFAQNWKSSVHFDLFSFQNEKRRVETTQGRLYTMLWRGEVGRWIFDPPLPLGVGEIPKGLISAEHLTSKSPKAPFFIIAVDHANGAHLAKMYDIQTEIKNQLAGEPRIVELQDVGLPNWNQFAPTIDLVLYETPNISEKKLHDVIKSVVYRPLRGAKKERFRIDAHGWLFGKDGYAGTTLFG